MPYLQFIQPHAYNDFDKPQLKMSIQWENNEEIQIFRDYLRIPSVQPNVNYDECIRFLTHQAKNLDLPFEIHHPGDPTKPIIIIKWQGTHPDLPTILLNSHMDVVPVFDEFWSHPPFGAEIDADGRIYARGSQDMKCVGMQYLGAVRALKQTNIQLKRTVLITFTPDEELGGTLGMMKFKTTKEFEMLNIGFALDEGIASPTAEIPVFYAERSVWRLRFTISGPTGHGSLLLKNTAGEKIDYLLSKFYEYRQNEITKLDENPHYTIGDVTTVNLTILRGGVQDNVIPPEMTIQFDVRLSINENHASFEEMIRLWMQKAGDGINLVFEHKEPYVAPTQLKNNRFWDAFNDAIADLGLQIRPQVFAGATDSRHIRNAGIPVIGFSPMNFTQVRLHDNDEYLKADTYLRGIDVYKKILCHIGNV